MNFILVIAALMILGGCMCDSASSSKSNKDDGSKNYSVIKMGRHGDDLKRYRDSENGVTCYRVSGSSGLSCLKIAEKDTTSESN